MNEVKENCEKNNVEEKNETTFKDIKGYKNINNIINYLITVGVWEMYTYEWLFNRKTYLYYHTLLKGYYFYDKNNNLTLFNDQNFFLYVCTFENTEFISYFFFNNSPKKIKLTSYTKTMQGRRKKQEDRFIAITDLTKYIDPNDYKTLFFYKINPFYFFSIFDGHRGIKACEYCLTHIIINIIYFFYNQQNVQDKNGDAKNENKEEPIDSTSDQMINPKKQKIEHHISTISDPPNGDNMDNKIADQCSGCDPENEGKQEKTDTVQNSQTNNVSDVNDINKEDNANKNKNKRSSVNIDGDDNVKKRKYDNKNNLKNIKICKDDINTEDINSDVNNKNEKPEHVDKCENIENDAKNENKPNDIDINNTKHNKEENYKYLDELSDDEIIEYLKLAFLKTDEQFLKASKFPNHGCTIVSLIIFKNKMYVANLGDCRALGIVNINNVLKPEPLSHDHKPNDPKEKERIKKMGGDVVCLQNVYRVKANTKKNDSEKPSLLERLSFKDEVYLAVSRAIGDKDFKHNNVISAMPDVVCKEIYDSSLNQNKNITDLENNNEIDEDYFKDSNLYLSSDEMNYHFVIMACDGVWDTLSNKDVTQIIQKYQNDPDKACSEIIKTAYSYGSQDNLTAMLLKLF
ncbi:protein phosphatase PPM9, putative [Plasmodium chabaudi chabaudi]|uniref:protein-serine/threonine phosphatase n=1 Tax=Plasmodium chabaudi chabaudi TaxID=31271 RepID=A0A4V0KAJ9_PLACU|nr:protein phosphatase PPM9, putative [Plasmodium chabaudi chabaudi]VTZ69826.1 protein phosphatase PPM9, putative [Plasmodium chabaudi chabaudi]|eukprot:XP_016654329.1 protein phosphatase 2C, putative [Plasmodium chabaudi chabaudi]